MGGTQPGRREFVGLAGPKIVLDGRDRRDKTLVEGELPAQQFRQRLDSGWRHGRAPESDVDLNLDPSCGQSCRDRDANSRVDGVFPDGSTDDTVAIELDAIFSGAVVLRPDFHFDVPVWWVALAPRMNEPMLQGLDRIIRTTHAGALRYAHPPTVER